MDINNITLSISEYEREMRDEYILLIIKYYTESTHRFKYYGGGGRGGRGGEGERRVCLRVGLKGRRDSV